jgi:hypothetical protein
MYVYYVELTYINIIMNKYEKWYTAITQRGQTRTLDSYTERHHILPRSLGGSDEKSNITVLTAREHFICHWLLTKIYKNDDEHWKMLNALRIMRAENKNQIRYETKITSRVYESIKEEYAKLHSQKFTGKNNGFYGKTHSEDVKKRISEANIGDKNGAKRPETRLKIAESKLGKKREDFDEDWKLNLSKNHKSKQPGFNGTLSEETKKRIGDKMRGRKQSEEEKKIRSLANMGKKREKKLCPHCGGMIAVNTYKRWHGDNCKKKI